MPRLFTPFYYFCSVKYDYVNREAINMRDFAAIDFETANNERTSVCSVGVVIDSGYILFAIPFQNTVVITLPTTITP